MNQTFNKRPTTNNPTHTHHLPSPVVCSPALVGALFVGAGAAVEGAVVDGNDVIVICVKVGLLKPLLTGVIGGLTLVVVAFGAADKLVMCVAVNGRVDNGRVEFCPGKVSFGSAMP